MACTMLNANATCFDKSIKKSITGASKTVASGVDIASILAGARDARAVGFSRFPTVLQSYQSNHKPRAAFH